MLNEYRRDDEYWGEWMGFAKSDVIPDLKKELLKLKNGIDEILNPESTMWKILCILVFLGLIISVITLLICYFKC